MSKSKSYKISSQLTNSRSYSQKSRNKLWNQFEKQIKKDESSYIIVKTISSDLKNYRKIEDRLNALLGIIEQAESFLAKHKHEQQVKSDRSIVWHEIETTVLTKRNIKKKNLHSKTLNSNQNNFENILKYIKSLEYKVGITLKALNNNTATEHDIHTLCTIKEKIKTLGKKIKAYFHKHCLYARKNAHTNHYPSTILALPEKCNVRLTSILQHSHDTNVSPRQNSF